MMRASITMSMSMARYASARELLQAVLARYRGLRAYADRGQVEIRLQGVPGRRGEQALPSESPQPWVMAFETALNADRDFRFAFDCPHPYPPLRHRVTRHVIGQSCGQAYSSRRDSRGQFMLQDQEKLEVVVAGATGISGGAAYTIAHLLFAELRGRSPLDLQRPRLRAEGLVNGMRCHRVRGRQPSGGRVTLYIGVDDLLLRRIVEHRRQHIETRTGITLQPAQPPGFFHPPAP